MEIIKLLEMAGPETILAVAGFGVIAWLVGQQAQNRKRDITHTFAILRIVGYGIKHSGWPIDILNYEIEATEKRLMTTEGQSLVSALVARGGGA